MSCVVCIYSSGVLVFFFFKQKTAYEMRIREWSSDVCSSDLNINRYRIVQESVTNALRHAQETEIDISLGKKRNGDLKLTIKDNGVGMNICNVDQTKHFGVLGMRERVQAMQGKFEVSSKPGAGTTVNVTIPKGQMA